MRQPGIIAGRYFTWLARNYLHMKEVTLGGLRIIYLRNQPRPRIRMPSLEPQVCYRYNGLDICLPR